MPQGFATAVRNPYGHLAALASAQVLQGEHQHAGHYALREVCVRAGALTAGAWLADERPCSRDEAIACSMFEAAPYLSLAPLPGSVVQDLFKRGFDWLVAFEVGNARSATADQRHAQEAV